MAIIQGNAKQGSTRGFYPKVINGSLRFNKLDNAYLEYDITTTGDPKTWTFSCWFKICTIANDPWYPRLFDVAPAATANKRTCITVHLESVGFQYYDGSTNYSMSFPHKYRDPSAWYHMVFVYDSRSTTTSTDRLRMYINGERLTPSSVTYPSDNFNSFANTSGNVMRLGNGVNDDGYDRNLDAYMANVHFIDGQALTASDFGETKNGVWVAKDYAGTFGTNGFYLTFEDDTQVEAFNTVLYTGNGSTVGQSVTGVGFAPDLIWLKARSAAGSHMLNDTVRGAGNMLLTNATNAEETGRTDKIESLDSDGFTIGSENNDVNQSGKTFVAWCWKAGDSNVSNTDGSITSTVRANDTYGFSIVSYTGNGSASQTVGHGLGSAPTNWMVILKNRTTGSTDWPTFHSAISSGRLKLNTTDDDFGNYPITFGTDTITLPSVNDLAWSASANDYIAYCWAEKTGYSKFGSYTGSGSAPSSLITTGFKPAFVMIKEADGVDGWGMYDATRNASNPRSYLLQAQDSSAESSATANYVDFESTGFKVCTGGSNGNFLNESGKTYIYAAFADTREAAFWLDQSGNDNDWQPVNLDHNDTVSDSPTDNFCTWNPLNKGTNLVTSDGNLSVNNSATEATHRTCVATHGMTSGKYYWEIEVNNSANVDMVGIVGQNATINSGHVGTSGFGYGYNTTNGNWYKASGWADDGTTPAAFPSSGTIGVAFDADNKKIYFSRNGVWINNANPTAGTGANGTYTGSETVFFPAISIYSNTGKWVANFGQQPFKYDPPA